jgi:hypothetical protein
MLGIASVSYTSRPLEAHRHPYYVRFSLELPGTEANNQYVFLDLDSVSPLAGTVPGIGNLRGGVGFVGIEGRGRRTQISDRNNWDPRIGLAYEVDQKTVPRSGFVFACGAARRSDSSVQSHEPVAQRFPAGYR